MADVKETRVPTGTALDPWAYTCFKTCIFGLAKKRKVAIQVRSVHPASPHASRMRGQPGL